MNLDPEIRWGQRALWLLDRVGIGKLTVQTPFDRGEYSEVQYVSAGGIPPVLPNAKAKVAATPTF